MLLERGRVVDIGPAPDIARQYNALNFRRVRQEARESGGPEILRRAPVAEVTNAVFEDRSGDVAVTLQQGEPCCIRMDVRFHAEAQNPIFGVSLRNDLGNVVFATSTHVDRTPTGVFRSDDTAVIRFRFDNWLGPGRHRLVATVAREGLGADLFDLHADSSVIVLANRAGGGSTDLPHTIEIERPSTLSHP
jgi:hypothetical protein